MVLWLYKCPLLPADLRLLDNSRRLYELFISRKIAT